METYFISMGIAAILNALKNPAHKRKFRNAFLKIYKAIKTAFADDAEFE